MTAANKITVGRILLIPVFVGFAMYYGESRESGQPVEGWRWAAIFVFLLAAASDGLDGFLARHFDQRTRLGSILDPIADMGLLLAAIITLSTSNWPEKFPLWFPILVVARDLLAIVGALLLVQVARLRELSPHWTGKVATVGQMAAVGALMLNFPSLITDILVWGAGAFTFASGMVYLKTGARWMQTSEDRE
ncbi:MAG: CDP-alcohol phosphatidyltransferase family protein [Verrucomicrobiales bacterium]